jgi:hypothetical protein
MDVAVVIPVDEKAHDAGRRRSTRWQHRLLPFMRAIVALMALFFFGASCLQLWYLNKSILDVPRVDTREATSMLSVRPQASGQEALAAARVHALVTLEASSIDRQYHQAGVLLMSRVWTSYMGFVTGMILSMVGAAFVLGKLEEEPSEMKGQAGTSFSVAFRSASPGLMLAVLGSILMIVTIVTHHPITVDHTATYLYDAPSFNGSVVGGTPPPLRLPPDSRTEP